jgi:bacteriorhodopsin
MIDAFYFSYIVIALVSSVLTLYLAYRQEVNRKLAGLHFIVSLWSGIIATNYFLNFIPGNLTLFADWLLTTPLLITALIMTYSDLKENLNWLAPILQAGVIISGILSLNNSLFFWIGSILLVPVFYITYRGIKTIKGKIAVGLFFLLWIGYPILFYLSTITQSISTETGLVGITILAVFSKQIFGFIDLLILDS